MAASAPARLITIPISHYCEKARWALDRAGIAYREERHVQIVHRVASRRAGGGGTVPVLVAPEGVFTQSADILAYADRHTSPARGCTPRTPRGGPRSSASSATSTPTSAPRAGAGSTSISSPSATSGARTTARACPRGSGAPSRCCSARCRATSATCSPSGPRPGRRRAPRSSGRSTRSPRAWTTGAATCAATPSPPPTSPSPRWPRPSLVPPEYGIPLPQPDELPPDMAAAVRAFRAHPAGAFALRLFREER